MKTAPRILLLIVSFVVVVCSAWAKDLSALYLQMYQEFQAGEKCERDGSPNEALDRYQNAQKLIEEIKKIDPQWRPDIVEYRSKKIHSYIDRLKLDVSDLPTIGDKREDSSAMSPPPVITTTRRSSSQTDELRSETMTNSSNESLLRKELAASRKEAEFLKEKLARRSAELKSALLEVDKTKVSVVELKAQLAQAQVSFENAMKDRDAREAQRPPPDDNRIKELTERIKALDADNEVLAEENERLLTKLESAAKYIDSADQGRKILETDRKKIAKQRDEALARTKRIKDNSVEIERLAEEKADLEKALKKEKRTAEAKRAEIKKIEIANEVLAEENERLLAKLENAAKYIDSADQGQKILETDRKKIAKQRDEARAQSKALEGKAAQLERAMEEKAAMEKAFAQEKKDLEAQLAKASDPAPLDKLATENKELAAKLAAAEQQVAQSASKQQESESVLASLRSEINGLNDRLLQAQAQVTGRDEKIKELAKQLDEVSGELARLKLNPEPTAEDKRLLSENDLLRGIILRQIKEEGEREKARAALEKEIQSLQIRSEAISQQLDILRLPAFRLSESEQALFDKPVTLLNDSSPSSMDVSIAISKPSEDQPKSSEDKKQEQPSAAQGEETLPDAAHALVEKAREFFDQGRYSEAEKLYEQIVESAPDNYFALANLGVTQIQALKLSAAEVALKKAISLNPNDSFAATNLGVVYCKQERFGEAIEMLKKAIAINPKDYIAYNYLGVCFAQKGSRNEAEENFKKSVALHDDYADAHFNLAVFYATSQPPMIEIIRQHYTKALALGAAPDASLERLLRLGAP